MKKKNYAGLCCLFVLLALFCACGANAGYSRRVVRQPHDSYYIELRQPGKQDVKALAQNLKEEALQRCEDAWFYKVWIRVLRVQYNQSAKETVGSVAFDCRIRKTHLW